MPINDLTIKNFQAYDYTLTNEILKKNYIFNQKPQISDNKTLVVCFGVNGSGKSTYIANLYSNKLLSLPYFSADLLEQSLRQEEKSLASKTATDIAFKLIDRGSSFCFESVLTHPSKIELLKKAKENGYYVVGVYVYANSSEKNKDRVKERVEQGGHYIPPEKIEERFKKMRNVVCDFIGVCHELYFFDNSQDLQLTTKMKINEKDGRECCQV